MFALQGRRHLTLALLLLAAVLALLSQTATAQSNMCYPTPGKRSKLKKGPCFMVSHTLPGFLGLDMPAALDPLSNDFVLVDRHTGNPIAPACARTKVYVSSDATAVDMGNFKREAWATQAMTLVQGKLQVDHVAIAANVAAENQPRKQSKHNVTTETIFMVEFQCPTAPAGGAGKWTSRQARHVEYRAALRYVPAPSNVVPSNFYQQFILHLLTLLGRTAPSNTDTVSSTSVTAASTDLSPSLDLIHKPLSGTLKLVLAKYGLDAVCAAMEGFQNTFLNDPAVTQNLGCTGNYPSYMQGLVDETRNLGTDRAGLRLPGPLANLLQQHNGYLPPQVDWATIEAEKATLFWLYEKTQRLGPWAACDDGSGNIQYGYGTDFAPGFTLHNLYEIHNDHELPGSNFTDTYLAMSGVGLDRANNKTFVLISRGTRSRTEWMIDLEYNQIYVDDDTLVHHPLLAPFKNTAIHSGFAGLFKQIYQDIKNDVTTVNPARIIVAGHSLGGGVVQLLSLALATDFPNIPVDAAMFAPPTAGDAAFADAFNRKVNGRRVAYVADGKFPSVPNFVINMGDVVAQSLLPDTPVCGLYKTNSTDPAVPVVTKTDARDYLDYEAVAGNVLFDWRAFPSSPFSYGLPLNTIQEAWRKTNNVNNGTNAHICSYSCFLSSAVSVDLTKCFINPSKDDKNLVVVNGLTLEQIKNRLPQNVQDYGLC